MIFYKAIIICPFAEVQDDDLWGIFEDCGTIENVRVIRDEQTGIGKGFGYINFKVILW